MIALGIAAILDSTTGEAIISLMPECTGWRGSRTGAS